MYRYSVIIPTFRREPETVFRAVQSVQAQTASDYHIFIVDDNENGSIYSDKLRDFFKCFDKLTLLKQDGNQGACAARNLGIAASECEYVAFLDDDDTWESEKAEEQLKLFQPDIGMVYCLGYLSIEKGNEVEIKDYYTKNHFKKEVNFFDLIRFDHLGSTTQAMVRKECFDTCGGFAKGLPARQDYEMWLRISKKYRILGVDKQLFTHYIYDGERITGNPQKALKGFQYVYKEFYRDYKKNPEAHKVILRWLSNAAKQAGAPCYVKYRTKLLFMD